MNLPQQTISVERMDGTMREYRLRYLGAGVGFDTFRKLLSIAAGPLGKVLGGAMDLDFKAIAAETGDVGDAKIPADALYSALDRIGVELDDPRIMEITEILMKTVDVIDKKKNHTPIVWETEFIGDGGAQLEVLFAAAKFNFRSYFCTGPAKGLLSAGPKLVQSFRPKESTGG